MTPAEIERIALLAEEAAEVVEICMKILRHGPTSYNPDDPGRIPNFRLLGRELGDLEYAKDLLLRAGELRPQDLSEGYGLANERKPKYLHHQKLSPSFRG